ncbi:hypothetical protein, partial [Mangrovibacter phragmitis]|uniref:hypothetical protein n=1 Tax=Mangrovibacter phragmitis TaxID=1691903 RepID=UPI0035181692
LRRTLSESWGFFAFVSQPIHPPSHPREHLPSRQVIPLCLHTPGSRRQRRHIRRPSLFPPEPLVLIAASTEQ